MPYYDNTNSGTAGKFNINKPSDDRFVVETQNDLFNSTTWTGRKLYDGLFTSVVFDENRDNYGIYMLPDASKYSKQSWDKNADNYDPDGWMKINSVAQTNVHMDTSTENEESYPGSFGGNGTEENPYYVSTINGGVI